MIQSQLAETALGKFLLEKTVKKLEIEFNAAQTKCLKMDSLQNLLTDLENKNKSVSQNQKHSYLLNYKEFLNIEVTECLYFR